MNKKFILGFLVICCLVILGILLFKMFLFMKAYENCKDDFEVINTCHIFPEEGNYSYFEDKYDINQNNNSLKLSLLKNGNN
jgi:hypothetical protein